MKKVTVCNTLSCENSLNQKLPRRAFIHKSLAAVASLWVFSNMPSLAADAASTINKAYLSTLEHVPVYSDEGLTQKMGSIYGDEDEIVLNSISSDRSVLNVTYPTAKGSRTGYISSSLVFPSWYGVKVTSQVKVTTYKWSNRSTTYGYISAGDTVNVYCGSSREVAQNGRYRVKYPVSGGYKLAWIESVELSRMMGESSQNVSSQKMSEALYQNSRARLTCGFDGYSSEHGKASIPDRHEGIDFSLSNGAAVYALTDGEVINVVSGARGSDGLSTIAVYIASEDKTVIYLHTAPAVSVGQRILKAQKIAVQDWRGVSSSGAGHTHVEMREGKRVQAAKSIDDPVLNNPDPSNFWKEHGYIVG